MKVTRILFHALALTMINTFSVLAGFGVWSLLRVRYAGLPQVPVQVAVAAGLSLLLGFLWLAWFPALRWPAMQLNTPREFALALPCALAWFPLVFYPLHYLTQGYLARFSNVLAVWAFQLPVDALALWLAYRAGNAAREAHA